MFKVVTIGDMMEMLTDYEFTIDATSDAGGELETFGSDAGFGIISAQQMCLWVAQNCKDTCPGECPAVSRQVLTVREQAIQKLVIVDLVCRSPFAPI